MRGAFHERFSAEMVIDLQRGMLADGEHVYTVLVKHLNDQLVAADMRIRELQKQLYACTLSEQTMRKMWREAIAERDAMDDKMRSAVHSYMFARPPKIIVTPPTPPASAAEAAAAAASTKAKSDDEGPRSDIE